MRASSERPFEMMADIVLLVFVTVSVLVGNTTCEVSLTSTVRTGAPVHLGDTVNFYCRTVGSRTLAWRSDEYIGRNGEQLSLSLLGSTSSLNSFAVATLNNSYMENGQRVLESTLTLIIQRNIPSASVTCYSIGTDESNTTALFHLAKNPTVSCGNPVVCPGDIRTFTCETRDSTTLAWESEQYIGTGGLRLSFFSFIAQPGDMRESPVNPNVSAILMVNSETNGVIVLKSELNIVVSPDILGDIHHLVTCVNVGLGTKMNYTLHMAQDGTSCGLAVPTESETTTQSLDYTDASEVHNINSGNSAGNGTEVSFIIAGAIVGVILVLGLVCVVFSCFVILKIKHKHVPVIVIAESSTESFGSEKDHGQL